MRKEPKIFSVSELNGAVKSVIDELFPYGVWVRGEIRDYKLHAASGHRYFVLRDKHSQVRCVMWRYYGTRLTIEPSDGELVRVYGVLSVFERNGVYSLHVQKIEREGVGSRAEEFARLKRKLAEEGLFDPEHKKPIPISPRRIGVITSSTGAAIRDIINVIRRRAPWIGIILRPALVQGENAADDIVRGIEEINRYGNVDLIIVGRGGGSEEDLWAFQEEKVARAIFDSQLPIVSAVGHEIDFSISDFVADLRAPTPSAAAELVSPDYRELKRKLEIFTTRAKTSFLGRLNLERERLFSLLRSPVFRRPVELFIPFEREVNDLYERARRKFEEKLIYKRRQLELIAAHIDALSPSNTMKRGYSLVTKMKNGGIIKSVQDIDFPEAIEVNFYEGIAEGKLEREKPKI